MSLQSNSELDEIEKVLYSLGNNPKMPDNIFDTTPPDQSEKKDEEDNFYVNREACYQLQRISVEHV